MGWQHEKQMPYLLYCHFSPGTPILALTPQFVTQERFFKFSRLGFLFFLLVPWIKCKVSHVQGSCSIFYHWATFLAPNLDFWLSKWKLASTSKVNTISTYLSEIQRYSLITAILLLITLITIFLNTSKPVLFFAMEIYILYHYTWVLVLKLVSLNLIGSLNPVHFLIYKTALIIPVLLTI